MSEDVILPSRWLDGDLATDWQFQCDSPPRVGAKSADGTQGAAKDGSRLVSYGFRTRAAARLRSPGERWEAGRS